MKQDKIIGLFKKHQAIQTGHFLLTSGNHSDIYIQCARILEKPVLAHRFCRLLAQHWKKSRIDVVAGPATGGIILAYEFAQILKARAIYLERVENHLSLRRGFTIKPKERVLIVEDVVTTGGSTKEVISVARKAKAKVIGVASLVNRSGKSNVFGIKFKTLINLKPPLYPPAQCPLCRTGSKAIKPGSRGLR